MTCLNQVMRVTSISFNGQNLSPIDKTAHIKLGGDIADAGLMNTNNQYFATFKREPSEVQFDIALTSAFNIKNFRNQCGDLQFLTASGASYLVTNAQFASNPELKDGDGKITLMFKGDPATVN